MEVFDIVQLFRMLEACTAKNAAPVTIVQGAECNQKHLKPGMNIAYQKIV